MKKLKAMLSTVKEAVSKKLANAKKIASMPFNKLKQVVVYTTVMVATQNAYAQGTVEAGLFNLRNIGIAAAGLLVTVAALVGLWMTFVGAKGLFDGAKSQDTPMQSGGKLIGGLVLVALMSWIAVILTDFGLEASTNSAINQDVFSATNGG